MPSSQIQKEIHAILNKKDGHPDMRKRIIMTFLTISAIVIAIAIAIVGDVSRAITGASNGWCCR
jgi:hypothetical protein